MQKNKEIYFYTSKDGKSHLREWLDGLDIQTRARILNRITRLEYGAYGDYKSIKNQIFELRFFFGKGYRIYFIEEQNRIILLLNGGDKDSQQKDIKLAQNLSNEYFNNKEK